LFTSSAYWCINNPLRDPERLDNGRPHPLSAVVCILADAMSKLRKAPSNFFDEKTYYGDGGGVKIKNL